MTSAFVGDVNTDRDELDIANASIVFTDRVEAIGGDIDLDGDVDFVDFLTFAGNFGRTGPVPSAQSQTTTVVIRDTIEVVRSIRDTFFANPDGVLSPINLQARVDVQSGGGDKTYSQIVSLTSASETVTIEIFCGWIWANPWFRSKFQDR